MTDHTDMGLATLDALRARLEQVEQERDALAAQVERIEGPATIFIENVDEVIGLLQSMGAPGNIVCLCRDLSAAGDQLAEALDSTATARLARLARRDARVKAEALHELLMFPRMGGEPVRAKAVKLRDGYRQQAEGGE